MVIYWNSNVNILIFWDTDFSWAVSSNHQNENKKKRLKCFTLHAMNLKYMKVSLFEITWTFSRHSNLLRCTCNFPSVWYRFHSSGQPYIHEKKISLHKESNNYAIVFFQMFLHVLPANPPARPVPGKKFRLRIFFCFNPCKCHFRCSFCVSLHCKDQFCWYWFNLLGNSPNASIWLKQHF